MSLDIGQFQEVFFEEAAENLDAMEGLLLGLDVGSPSGEDLNAIFRAAHSIKGGAGMFGLDDIATFTHVLETLLDRLRKRELNLTPAHVDAFLEASDLIRAMIVAHGCASEPDRQAIDDCRRRLAALSSADTVPEPVARPAPGALPAAATAPSGGPSAAAVCLVHTSWLLEIGPTTPEVFERISGDLALQGRVAIRSAPAVSGGGTWVLLFDGTTTEEMLRCELEFVLPPEAISILAIPPGSPEALDLLPPSDLQPAAPDDFGFFDDAPALAAPVAATPDDEFGFFGDAPDPAAPTAAAPAAPPASARPATAVSAAANTDASSIRVGVSKVDQLINLVGELVINQAMLSETVSRVDPALCEQLANGLAQLERNTRNLQESVMSMRLVPVSSVFSRFPRVVRDISRRLGKDIELRFVGENTEIDRGVIEKIADPLTHLVRNSLDHGIELPGVRTAAGKPAQGTLTLRASQRGANILIEVIDDGAGLRRDRILAKARERGFEVSESMPDADVWQLIFEPGFSTAEQVTDVSGRGVGMDVVRRNIGELGGRIDIDSVAGLGTHITIRLPLTLAILDGLSVALGDETYIIPLAYIVESLQPQSPEISSVGGDRFVVKVRHEYLPVLGLSTVLGGSPRAARFEDGIFVILESDATKIALFVDELVGENQVVIKSLESNYAKVTGISGATILGDGRVALILDVAALVRRYSNTAPRSPA